VGGVLIRDLIFYNFISHRLLKEIYEKYKSKQIVVELKNTREVTTTHVNQLNRYLNNEFGSFGIIFTRNKPPNNVFKNTINLWAGQRKCILILDDEDLKLMCQVYENKQRKPIDVINRKYVEFMRSCPS
jgi:c-di-GMP-related signal transduction protein